MPILALSQQYSCVKYNFLCTPPCLTRMHTNTNSIKFSILYTITWIGALWISYLYLSTIDDSARNVLPGTICIFSVTESDEPKSLWAPLVEDNLSIYNVTIALQIKCEYDKALLCRCASTVSDDTQIKATDSCMSLSIHDINQLPNVITVRTCTSKHLVIITCS